MALMDQFRPQGQQAGLSQQMAQLRSILSGDLTPLVRMASDPSNRCQMPDGRMLTFGEFAKEMSGKSANEMFAECGYDINDVMGVLNS